MLTDTAVRQTKAGQKHQYLFDGGGLYLHVAPSGGKWWRLKFRFQGKPRLLSLGVYPDISLRDARDRRESARKLLAQGIDPGEDRKNTKREAEVRRDNSFAKIAEAWFDRKSVTWAPSTARKARIYLDKDLLPTLGQRPIVEIRRTDLVKVLAHIERREAYDVAKKCRGWLSGVFRYALASGLLEVNVATDLDAVAAPAPRSREMAHLSIDELPAFLKALDGYGGEPATVMAIRLLLLTTVRPGELRAAKWSEFDLEKALWDIPAERMKMRRPHVVPLTVQAVRILRQLETTGVRRELVFPSRDDPHQPISENTINLAIHRIGYKGRQTGHGFRHLVSTALNERRYNSDWIEFQLAHGDKNVMRGIYNKAKYLDQRREMMQAWADHLDAMSHDPTVVAGNFRMAA